MHCNHQRGQDRAFVGKREYRSRWWRRRRSARADDPRKLPLESDDWRPPGRKRRGQRRWRVEWRARHAIIDGACKLSWERLFRRSGSWSTWGRYTSERAARSAVSCLNGKELTRLRCWPGWNTWFEYRLVHEPSGAVLVEPTGFPSHGA